MSATPHTSYKTILEFRISFMCTKIISVVAKILPKNRGKQTPELRIDSRLLNLSTFTTRALYHHPINSRQEKGETTHINVNLLCVTVNGYK